MVFSSLSFLYLFLPLTLGLYALLARLEGPSSTRLRNALLLCASLVFYAWGEPVYILLMLASILINYAAGRLIGYLQSLKQLPAERIVFWLAVAINIGLLIAFKYAGFLAAQLRLVWPGLLPGFTGLRLPIGISFYSFQILSYIIDLHRRELGVQRSLIDLGTYIAFFPQLIAGPIVRLTDIVEQLRARDEHWALRASGARRFLVGLGKKVLLANRLGALWESLAGLDPGALPVSGAWLGGLAFGLQIYFDFSGYSDMALGLARLFGFRLVENFDYPYLATSVTDFWRRWHLTLSGWFRRYVYLPLGGNRRGLARQLVNILIVWLLTGLWHGASWNFVVWGLYFALLLVLEKLVLLRLFARLPALVGRLWTLVAVLASWLFFAQTSLAQGGAWLLRLVGLGGAAAADGVAATQQFVATSWRTSLPLLALACIAATPWPRRLALRLGLVRRPAAMTELPGAPRRDRRASDGMVPDQTALLPTGRVATILGLAGQLALLLLSTAALVNDAYNPFLYFRF